MEILHNNGFDLIYTNKNREDVGVIQGYELDMAYGADENSFELTVERESYKIELDSYIYVDGTEYGGIVDWMEVDTKNNTWIYGGRTIQGILAGLVVCPPKGKDYLEINEPSANLAITRILNAIGFNNYKVKENEPIMAANINGYMLSGWQYYDNYGIRKQATGVYDIDQKTYSFYGNFQSETFASTRIEKGSVGDNMWVPALMGNKDFYYDYDNPRIEKAVDTSTIYGITFGKGSEAKATGDLFIPQLVDADDYSYNYKISNVRFRYTDAYTALLNMLQEHGLKPVFSFEKISHSIAIRVSFDLITNYAVDDEWTINEHRFVAKKVKNKVNHVVALGQGDLKDRYVIHVYADTAGNIVPWYKSDHYTNNVAGWIETQLYCQVWEIDDDYLDPIPLIYNVAENKYFLPINGNYINGNVNGIKFIYFDAEGKHEITCKDLSMQGDGGMHEDVVYPITVLRDTDYLPEGLCVLDQHEIITEVYDCPNAETVDNYIILKEQPLDFANNFSNYYSFDEENNKFEELQTHNEYVAMPTQPSNWSDSYANYYEYDNENYKSISGIEITLYNQLSIQPYDWNWNCTSYKIRETDGVTESFRAVSMNEVKGYVKQSSKPSDWESNFSSYYEWTTTYVKNTSKTWKKNTFYQDKTGKKDRNGVWSKKPSNWKETYQNYYVKETFYHTVKAVKNKAPKWKSDKYYTLKKINETVPAFGTLANQYGVYKEVTTTSAPAFVPNKYYKDTEIKPKWAPNTYYECSHDHYRTLVEGAIEILKSAANSDKIEMELYDDLDYSIGDIVGVVDDKTNLEIAPSISKKIVKIKNGITSISYEIGGGE